jgi:hypothetical protein
VCEARAFAAQGGVETLIATMTGTLMAQPRRESIEPRPEVRTAEN